MTLNGSLPVLPLTRPIQSVRHAPDLADRDDEADEAANQQPRAALDRQQDADAEDDAHSDPDRESAKQFHGAYVTRLGQRFKLSV